MALKAKINQVGEDPYLPEFVETPQYQYPRVPTLILASPEFDGPITGKFREKLESLSLKKSSFFLSLFSVCSPLSFTPPQPAWSRGGQEDLSSSCHMSAYHWHLGFSLPLYPSTLDFHPIPWCHMSLMGPLGLICLTHPTLDTWHLLGYPKHAKCPPPLSVSRKM